MPTGPSKLAPLFHRRWSVPILAEMAAHDGCRVAQLTHALEAGRQPVALIALGLVRPNPGYGHPLRPEYVLTRRGGRAGPACTGLMRALREAEAIDVGLRKWSMPTLAAVGLGATRFGAIARALGDATDRAISQALGGLGEAGLVERRVEGGRPPAPRYALTAEGLLVRAPVLKLV
jgi:DNA-binding HxlR family transcriptional regulator